jgi:hypothetical protein
MIKQFPGIYPEVDRVDPPAVVNRKLAPETHRPRTLLQPEVPPLFASATEPEVELGPIEVADPEIPRRVEKEAVV